MLCTMVLNGVSEGIKNLDLAIGRDFNVVTISMNPKDTLENGRLKKKNYLEHYNSASDMGKVRKAEETLAGWHFFTGEEVKIKALADQLGFSYRYDEEQKQYAHSAVTFILTPEGKISRYLYGIQYRPLDLRFALVEASQSKVGNVIDRLLMFCYHYDPSRRGYTLQATRVMQAGGLGTIMALGGYLTLFWTRQRKGKERNDKVL
jgi:protein SCO1